MIITIKYWLVNLKALIAMFLKIVYQWIKNNICLFSLIIIMIYN